MATISEFCPNCGAPRAADSRFCGACGQAFVEATRVPRASAESPRRKAGGEVANWSVVVGADVPDTVVREAVASVASSAPSKKIGRARSQSAPVTPGAPLGKSTVWVALTQMADLVTQSMASVGTSYTSERLMLASATAVLAVTLRKRPRLRQWLVRLGTLGIGLLQGGSLAAVLKSFAGDPQQLASLAPNLAAQVMSLLAILKLFKAAGHRR